MNNFNYYDNICNFDNFLPILHEPSSPSLKSDFSSRPARLSIWLLLLVCCTVPPVIKTSNINNTEKQY